MLMWNHVFVHLSKCHLLLVYFLRFANYLSRLNIIFGMHIRKHARGSSH